MAANPHISNDEVRRLLNLAAEEAKGTHDRAQFFAKLTDLFNSRRAKDHGSIYLTQKRRTAPPPPLLA
ncbi:hypothetical protein IWX90DRAFT_442597 [Phyllosticta citrichinensis]|uniref:Uncharacterized protein n=1 Tax=Phyllosticta citrichinensis TaxID=1130410 RepID=A0ABR1XK74_9PEZI